MLLGVAEPDPAALERSLADQVTAWREQHGDRIVYIGGTFHTAVATRRAMADTPTEVVPTAGSLLRSHLGAGYLSVGLTFGSGSTPQDVPNPPASLEGRLDTMPHGTFPLEPREPTNHRWLHDTTASGSSAPATTPTMTRITP
jgi:erythromycin esterase